MTYQLVFSHIHRSVPSRVIKNPVSISYNFLHLIITFHERSVKSPKNPRSFTDKTSLKFSAHRVSKTEHKHLGLILDPPLSFAAHFKEKVAKARKGIGLIKHLRSYLPTKMRFAPTPSPTSGYVRIL